MSLFIVSILLLIVSYYHMKYSDLINGKESDPNTVTRYGLVKRVIFFFFLALFPLAPLIHFAALPQLCSPPSTILKIILFLSLIVNGMLFIFMMGAAVLLLCCRKKPQLSFRALRDKKEKICWRLNSWQCRVLMTVLFALFLASAVAMTLAAFVIGTPKNVSGEEKSCISRYNAISQRNMCPSNITALYFSK